MPPLATDLGVGIRSAAAKDYYTRKRVNGRWVHGRFPRQAAHRDRAGTQISKTAARKTARAASALPEQTTPPSPDIQATSALPGAPLLADERMRQLQQALEAKAKAMARNLPAAPPPPPAAAPTPARSVTFDFESGLKTMFLSDGTVLEEPFDVATAQSLGIAPQARPEPPDHGTPNPTKPPQRR